MWPGGSPGIHELETGAVVYKLLSIYSRKLGVSMLDAATGTMPSLNTEAKPTPQIKLCALLVPTSCLLNKKKFS